MDYEIFVMNCLLFQRVSFCCLLLVCRIFWKSSRNLFFVLFRLRQRKWKAVVKILFRDFPWTLEDQQQQCCLSKIFMNYVGWNFHWKCQSHEHDEQFQSRLVIESNWKWKKFLYFWQFFFVLIKMFWTLKFVSFEDFAEAQL